VSAASRRTGTLSQVLCLVRRLPKMPGASTAPGMKWTGCPAGC
jgi:hypothetical protein